MDVRCEKCQTEYELDEARLKPSGVTVKCTNCGHMFKIRKRSTTNVGACGDSFWREIVELFLKAHSAAVIDVTEVSENVLWEIGTSLRVLGPESIVLAYGVAADGEKKFSDERRAQLAERFGGELDGVQTFLYPLSRKQLKRDGWGSRNELTLELRKKLAVGITYAKQKVEVQEAFGDVAA